MVTSVYSLVLSIAAYCSMVGWATVCLASHRQRTTGLFPGFGHYE